MALNSRICELLKIDYPIVLAGMGGASVPALAAAVSNAGGLGVLGAAACAPERLRAWIRQIRELTDKPFGVDTLLPASVRRGKPAPDGAAPVDPMELAAEYRQFAEEFMAREGLAKADSEAARRAIGGRDAEGGPPLFSKEFFEAQMEVVIEEKVPVYAAGLGNPGPWMDRLHANGTIVMAVVGKVQHARQVVESGIDVIVAQGHDGGGHNSPIGTISLIPQVVDAVGDRVPVLGAGGIGSGRQVAASLALGSQGVWTGSIWLGTEEYRNLSANHSAWETAFTRATSADTVRTRVYTGKPARLLKTKWTEAWNEEGAPQPLPMPLQNLLVAEAHNRIVASNDPDVISMPVGQIVGRMNEVRPVADVMADLVSGFEEAVATLDKING